MNWHQGAACLGAESGDFFGPYDEAPAARLIREARAKAICAGCPVRIPCLEWALTFPEREGVWGGRGEAELANERRRRTHLRLAAEHAAAGVKTCTQCRVPKPLDQFSPHGKYRQPACKECRSRAARKVAA